MWHVEPTRHNIEPIQWTTAMNSRFHFSWIYLYVRQSFFLWPISFPLKNIKNTHSSWLKQNHCEIPIVIWDGENPISLTSFYCIYRKPTSFLASAFLGIVFRLMLSVHWLRDSRSSLKYLQDTTTLVNLQLIDCVHHTRLDLKLLRSTPAYPPATFTSWLNLQL